MKPSRIVASAWVLCLAVALFVLAPLARAQVLQQVPADALVVIKINKLKPVSDKLAALAQKLGLAQMSPQMADPLGSLQKEAGVQNGLDTSGDAAFVLLNGNIEGPKPPALILVPVTDYKAFLANFGEAKTEGDISTVHPKNDPEDTYVANWGKYAVMSPQKELLSRKPEGLTATGLSAKELESKDIVAYVNMKTARARLLPAITKARAKFLADFERNMSRAARGPARRPGAPGAAPQPAPAANAQMQKFMPLAKTFINRFIDVAEQVVRDSDAATYGVSLTDAGVNGTVMAEFAAGSPSATRVTQLKGSDQSMLAGLPQVKYLMFGGSVDATQAVQKLVADFLAPVEKEFPALGEDGKALGDWADSIKQLFGATKSSAFGMVTPSGMIGQDAIIQPVSVATGDAKTIIDAQRKMFQSQQAVMDLMTPAGAKMQIKTSYVANAKTIDGVSLNQMQTTFGGAQPGQPMNAQQAQMQQMMTLMYGPGGMNAWVGMIGANKVVTAAGASDDVLAKLIAAAKGGQDVLSSTPGVQATAKQLPQQRIAAFYVALDQIALSIANYAKAFGMPINFQVPANLPPLGFTFASDGAALRGDWHVPAQTMQSIIAAVMQVKMQMEGGQQPGGPGGL
jgi:hypothetical protein